MPVLGWVAFAILATGLLILLVGGDSDQILGLQTEQLAALTAALALLVYVGSGVFGRGQSAGPLLRHLLLWTALLLAVSLGYVLYQNWIG